MNRRILVTLPSDTNNAFLHRDCARREQHHRPRPGGGLRPRQRARLHFAEHLDARAGQRRSECVDRRVLSRGHGIENDCGARDRPVPRRARRPGALADPTLEFFNGQGTKIDENNDWETSPNKAQIQSSGLAPTNAKESAVLQTLAAGPYTAVVRGANSGTGIGSVEVYQLP